MPLQPGDQRTLFEIDKNFQASLFYCCGRTKTLLHVLFNVSLHDRGIVMSTAAVPQDMSCHPSKLRTNCHVAVTEPWASSCHPEQKTGDYYVAEHQIW